MTILGNISAESKQARKEILLTDIFVVVSHILSIGYSSDSPVVELSAWFLSNVVDDL